MISDICIIFISYLYRFSITFSRFSFHYMFYGLVCCFCLFQVQISFLDDKRRYLKEIQKITRRQNFSNTFSRATSRVPVMHPRLCSLLCLTLNTFSRVLLRVTVMRVMSCNRSTLQVLIFFPFSSRDVYFWTLRHFGTVFNGP